MRPGLWLLVLGARAADACKPKSGETWRVGAYTFALAPEGSTSCNDIGDGCEDFKDVIDCSVCKLAEGGCVGQAEGWGGCASVLWGDGQFEEEQHNRIKSMQAPPGCFIKRGSARFMFNVDATSSPTHDDIAGTRHICAAEPVVLDVPVNAHVGLQYVPPCCWDCMQSPPDPSGDAATFNKQTDVVAKFNRTMGICDKDSDPPSTSAIRYEETHPNEHNRGNYHCFMCPNPSNFVDTRGLQCDVEPSEYSDHKTHWLSVYAITRIVLFLTCGVFAIAVFGPMQTGLTTWSTPLHGCFQDLGTCFMVTMCPCLAWGDIAQKALGFPRRLASAVYVLLLPCRCLCLCPCLGMSSRTALRKRLQIGGQSGQDGFIHCFAHECALCQESREIQRMAASDMLFPAQAQQPLFAGEDPVEHPGTLRGSMSMRSIQSPAAGRSSVAHITDMIDNHVGQYSPKNSPANAGRAGTKPVTPLLLAEPTSLPRVQAMAARTSHRLSMNVP